MAKKLKQDSTPVSTVLDVPATSVPTIPASDRVRQGRAPACPYCKDAHGVPNVLCKSQGSGPYFTRYKCPTQGCTYRINVPREKIAERVKAAEDADIDFSARPKS